MSEQALSLHPGKYIKAEVIPIGMSVTAVPKLLGVGRPALSNLLNGNSALSSDMARRIEQAFNKLREELFQMQAVYDASVAPEKSAPVKGMTYVPSFLSIKANDIQARADHNIPARIRLSVFLRTLVNSTGIGLTKVDFPGNDDAERPRMGRYRPGERWHAMDSRRSLGLGMGNEFRYQGQSRQGFQ